MRKQGAHSVANKGHGFAHKHKLARRIALAAGCAAALALALVIVFVPVPQQARDAASDRLQEVMAAVDHANTHVAQLSELLAGGLDDAAVQQAQQLVEGKAEAEGELAAALDDLNTFRRNLDAQDARAAALLEQGIQARRDMLENGTAVLEASVRAYRLSGDVQKLWQALLDGHDALTASAAQLQVGTTPAVKKALASDEKAKETYQTALGLMDDLRAQAPGYAFSEERSYADKQVQAADEAIAADKALLAGDTEAAQQHMAAYQNAAVEAASIAESLPGTADDLLKSIYYSLGTDGLSVADAEAAYADAASRTAHCDEKLAAYRTSKGYQS